MKKTYKELERPMKCGCQVVLVTITEDGGKQHSYEAVKRNPKCPRPPKVRN